MQSFRPTVGHPNFTCFATIETECLLQPGSSAGAKQSRQLMNQAVCFFWSEGYSSMWSTDVAMITSL